VVEGVADQLGGRVQAQRLHHLVLVGLGDDDVRPQLPDSLDQRAAVADRAHQLELVL